MSDPAGVAVATGASAVPRADSSLSNPDLAPVPPEETARFAARPPDLRVIARAIFLGGSVDVPRCAEPLPWAGRILREESGCEAMHPRKVSWALRHTADRKEIVEMPGWRSTVHFTTRLVEPRQT